MPKKRLPANVGLPARCRHTHGAYYYQVPPGMEALWDGKKTFRLGKTLSEAYRELAKRKETSEKVKTIAQLLDRYAIEVIPTKAPKTQKDNVKQVKRLRAVFGDMVLQSIEPRHIYTYADKREAPVAAKREIALLSHAFTKAVQWGYISQHPFKGQVRIANNPARDRYVEDWEVAEVLSMSAPELRGGVRVIQVYICIKNITGMRRGDMLRLKLTDLKEDGIHIQTNKTGKRTIYKWTPRLRELVEMAKAVRPVDISPLLFCTKFGGCYVNSDGEAPSFDSMWQRFMKRVLTETEVTERFTEHDLRAKAGSDATSDEHARMLLSHANVNTTKRIYRRKPEEVIPLR